PDPFGWNGSPDNARDNILRISPGALSRTRARARSNSREEAVVLSKAQFVNCFTCRPLTPVAFYRNESSQSTAEDDMSRDIVAEYRRLHAKDRSAFRKWLIANTVFGATAIFALIVLAAVYSGGDAGSVTAHKQQHQVIVR